MNEQVQKARRLISAVGLTDVRLVKLHASTSIASADVTEDILPRYRHWASVVPRGLRNNVFHVRANLDLQIGNEPKPQLVSVKIQYELEYMVPERFKPSRSEIEAFAQVNGVFNAWPYFREIVQTVTQRMDLPAVILPVYRVPQAPASSDKETP